MIRTTHMFRRVAEGGAAVAAAALLAAPAAPAATSRFGPHDTWYPYARSLMQAQSPDPWLGYAVALTSRARSTGQAGATFTTDTLGGSGHAEQAPAVRFVSDTLAPGGGTPGATFTTDTLGGSGHAEQAPAVRFVSDTLAPGGGTTVAQGATRFDWGDAGVGAAAAIGLVLLASVAVVAMSRRRGRLAF